MLAGCQILVLEDEALLRKTLCRYLESKGAVVFPAENMAEARRIRDGAELDYALLDINLPDGSGLDLLDQPGFSRNTRVVVMTAEGGVRSAVAAMRRGAIDYLAKPFEPEELPMVLARASQDHARSRIREFEQESRATPALTLFIGERLKAVESQLNKILQTDQRLGRALPPVLIEGETGTGKSTLARWLHGNGPRHQAPLIEVVCSSLPEPLAESELFGHERGAFTDARKERIGLFEAADGGTLFLDEISSLSLAIQAKVLTAIEDRRIRRVGGNTQRAIDVRLITASLHPLDRLVKEGSFREDLCQRLNLLRVRIPPLREFPEDIPELARHLLAGLQKRYRRPEVTLAPVAHQRLMAYAWPGNVRELIHELERALIFHEAGPLDFAHLGGAAAPAGIPQDAPPPLLNPEWVLPAEEFQFEDALQALTRQVIDEALRQEEGNVSAAARRLGVPRDYVRYRIADQTGN